ncbi:MAG: LrgB family protein [Acidaminococcaceae bacterium]
MPATLLSSPLLGLALTVIAYKIGEKVSERFNLTLLPPFVTCCAIIMLLIHQAGLFTYQQYEVGGAMINFLLGPATVALALPLVRNKHILRQHGAILLGGVLIGTCSGIISVALCAKALGASHLVAMSLVPKSVTTPIAMDISAAIGGIPALTAACVIITGIFGATCGHKLLALVGVKNDIAIGLAIGASSHGLGASSCIAKSSMQVAISSLAIALVGIATALLAPLLLPYL